MTDLGSACAILLAATFAWAGAGKLVAPAATRASFVGLGVPAAGLMARVVPALELALAFGLLTAPRAAGPTAVVLLLAFSAVLVRAIARGVTVGCRCFGGGGHAPLSPSQLVRNSGLVAAAAAASSVTTVETPAVEAVVLVSCLALLTALAVAAIDLRRGLGALWRVALPGETP